ncbi:MAG: hypothetical protein KDK28_14020 [Maritimibacter sp.]|nr:hypothetical protein [Maritimibacter sp.]
MPIHLPTDLDSAALAAAETGFAERRARRDLAGLDDTAEAEARPSLGDLLSGKARMAGPVPIGLLRLQRHAARARATAISPAARAAHTSGETARTIGPFQLRLIDEDDLVFLTITGPDPENLPTTLDAFIEEERRHVALTLPKAVSETVMLGLDPKTEFGKDVIDILGHAAAEIILS